MQNISFMLGTLFLQEKNIIIYQHDFFFLTKEKKLSLT